MDDYQGPRELEYVSKLGRQLDADYILFGSLTSFGESISLDATMVNLIKKMPPAKFFFHTKGMESVIPEINTFAQKVYAEILGRDYQDTEPAHVSRAPDSERQVDSKVSLLGPDSGKFDQVDIKGNSFWKSKPFRTKFLGIAIGDVDGDKRNETVIISHNHIFVYRNIDGRFNKVVEMKVKSYHNYIGVDVADINKNGKSEIFVTDLRRNGGGLKSFVLEWDGRKFSKIADNENWYYRVINVPGRGNILLGQKRGINDILRGSVYELKWGNGRYAPGKKQVLPKWLNVFGFTYGEVMNNGQEMIVAFTQNDHLRILTRDGNEEWTSIERYGGSDTYLDMPSETVPAESRVSDRGRISHTYLPQRIHVADLDNDGKKEVIVVKNEDAVGRSLGRVRHFKSGHIECLSWNGFGLNLKWKTGKISGYISDYAIGDLNNDGQDEILLSVVTKTGFFTGKQRSFVVSQDVIR